MKVAIVDDHPLIREGFKTAVLQAFPTAEVFTRSDRQTLFSLLEEEVIDILFLDIRLENDDARIFMNELKMRFSEVKIVIISSLSDISTIRAILRQGADGFLLKSDPKSEIARAIKKVFYEKTQFLSRGIKLDHDNLAEQHPELTPREKQILSLIIHGKTTKQISETLFISEKTVESHRSNLFRKFDVSNVARLVKKAILQGYM